ncbi:SDR family oxidoreductase [Rhodovibrionaceae bacterium A322]
MPLTGKRVLVTAGAAGIGKVFAKTFLAAGAKVAVCDVDEAALSAFQQEEPDLLTCRADVSSEKEVDQLFGFVEARLGGLDFLLNNAGIAGPSGRVDSLDFEGWRACFAVNLDGAFLCAKKAVPLLEAADGGAIINMSSTAGIMGYPYRSPYAAAKWAIVGLTKTLAMELGELGIRVNALCPGPVSGERMERVIAAESAVRGIPETEMAALYASQVSLRRFVTPEEVAQAALFLCSPAGSAISGQALPVDGHTEKLVP